MAGTPAASISASPLKIRISAPGNTMAAAQNRAAQPTVPATLKRMDCRTRLYSPAP